MDPASHFKQALGLFLLAIGYLVIEFGVKGIDPSTKVSMIWLVSLYTIHTFGELCLSPIGLSMVNKLSPVKLASLLMGVWFLSTASANKFAGTLSALYPEEVKIDKKYLAETSPAVLASLAAYPVDSNVWNSDPKSSVNIPMAQLLSQRNYKDKDSVTAIEGVNGQSAPISVFHLKVIRSSNSNIDRAVALEGGRFLLTHEISEESKDKKIVKTEKLQIWDLKPEKPSFAGMKIDNLYDFFMLFVIMAGAAGVILFFLSKKLLTMMHDIR